MIEEENLENEKILQNNSSDEDDGDYDKDGKKIDKKKKKGKCVIF